MARTFSMTLAALTLLGTLPAASLQGDSLGSLRSDVRTARPEDPAAPREPSSRHEHDWCDDDCDDSLSLSSGFGQALAAGTLFVASLPFLVPNAAIEDADAGYAYFTEYPYHHDSPPGAMIFDNLAWDGAPPNKFTEALRLRGEYLDGFEGLTRYSGHILYERARDSRLGFDAEIDYWREEFGPGAHDSLWTGDANILYRFAQSEQIQLRAGGGIAWLADQHDTELGLNFTYGGDWYPLRPLVFSAEMDAGWIGEAWLIHLRATAGVQWNRAEFYAGYDYLEIGHTQLDGFITGVRLSF